MSAELLEEALEHSVAGLIPLAASEPMIMILWGRFCFCDSMSEVGAAGTFLRCISRLIREEMEAFSEEGVGDGGIFST